MGIKSLLNRWRGAKKEEVLPPVKKRGKLSATLKQVRPWRVKLEMDELGKAIDAARDTERPDYDNLYSIYNQIQKDRHLKAQVETAINDIQQSPFVVEVDGKEDEELRDLFDREWFDDFIEYASEAEMWSHSLVEFPKPNDKGEFDACFLIPRENVNPALGIIYIDKFSNKLLPYREKLAELNLVEIEGKEELGIFEYAAEEVILKKYARTDWSQASEKYGMPILDYATDATDKKELAEIDDMCDNLAARGWIRHSTDDKVEIKQAQNGDFYKIYAEAIALSNEEISKLLNGQTGTADNQAWAGTAGVHERILNMFTKARLRRVQNHVNGKLIPLMVANSYTMSDKLSRAKVKYTDLLEKEPQLPTEPEPQPGTKSAQNRAGLKKKAQGNFPW